MEKSQKEEEVKKEIKEESKPEKDYNIVAPRTKTNLTSKASELKKYITPNLKKNNPEYDWEYLQDQLKKFGYSVEKFGPIVLRRVHGKNRFFRGQYIVQALLDINSAERIPYSWKKQIRKRHGRRKKVDHPEARN